MNNGITESRLHGFRHSDTVNKEHLCSTLLSDKKIMFILNAIAIEYGDMFKWVGFSRNDKHSVGCEKAREQMTLFYKDTNSLNGGMEINFYLWSEDKLVIELLAMNNHDIDENDVSFNEEWDISVQDELFLHLIITPIILDYLGVYKDGGVSELVEYADEAQRYKDEIAVKEEMLLDEITPLVMDELTDDAKKHLMQYPNAIHHHFEIGLWIRNRFLHSREEIEPDSISNEIIKRIIVQLKFSDESGDSNVTR